MKQPVVFWGGTGQSKVLREAISHENYILVAIVDNQEIKNQHNEIVLLKGQKGLLKWLEVQPNVSNIGCAVAIGGHRGRERVALLETMKSLGLTLLTITHPSAFVSCNAIIEEGCQILANSSVCVDVKLGTGCIINTSASVDHDCVLGNGVHIGPGANLAGEITVGDGSFVGAGATVLPGLNIGADVIIGAGAVVVRDVEAGALMVGNPAKKLIKRSN
jgi:sugar O-acyltransferase (sialic acid O-acetyltransferase NeuD family)